MSIIINEIKSKHFLTASASNSLEYSYKLCQRLSLHHSFAKAWGKLKTLSLAVGGKKNRKIKKKQLQE